jgi:quercetin dioxygenase-like cupin family protein
MRKSSASDAKTLRYQVKDIEPVLTSSEVRARLFTLAPGDVIPWHYHREATDHYFILQGELTISTRLPKQSRRVTVGVRRARLISLPTAPPPIANFCRSRALARLIR